MISGSIGMHLGYNARTSLMNLSAQVDQGNWGRANSQSRRTDDVTLVANTELVVQPWMERGGGCLSLGYPPFGTRARPMTGGLLSPSAMPGALMTSDTRAEPALTAPPVSPRS